MALKRAADLGAVDIFLTGTGVGATVGAEEKNLRKRLLSVLAVVEEEWVGGEKAEDG